MNIDDQRPTDRLQGLFTHALQRPRNVIEA